MKKRDKTIIEKIISYIDRALSYTEEMTEESFIENSMTFDASALMVLQIGELSKSISDEVKSRYNMPWKEMAGLRNKIAHNYDDVNLSTLWWIIKQNLPDLKSNLSAILNIEKIDASTDFDDIVYL
jgi:uncharacterized protein with HEPN domain